MRKPAFCICEKEDEDQLCSNSTADQHLCFRYIDSTIPLLPIYEISSPLSSCVVVQPGLCGTWSETQKTGFSHNEAHILLVSTPVYCLDYGSTANTDDKLRRFIDDSIATVQIGTNLWPEFVKIH